MAKRTAQRLDTPLVRDNGVLRPATWDEALDRAAEGFRAAVAKKDPQTFGLFRCAKATMRMHLLAQKFARTVIGSNISVSCNRIRYARSVVGLATVFGMGGVTSAYREVEDTDLIILWGSDARLAHPIDF